MPVLSLNGVTAEPKVKSEEHYELLRSIWDAHFEFGDKKESLAARFDVDRDVVSIALTGIPFLPGSQCLSCRSAIVRASPYGVCIVCQHTGKG